MKAIRKIGMWKAIAFLAVVISMFSCTACEPEVLLKPQATISAAENITTTSATIVAYVTPNGEASISFEYQANNSTWVVKTLPTKFNGTDKIKVTLDLYDLQPSTLYNFRVTAVNEAGSITVGSTGSFSDGSFKTLGLTKAVVVIRDATDVKISSAKINAVVIPNQDNSSVTFEYKTTNSTWSSQVLPTNFSGSDSIKVNFDLSSLQANTTYNFRVKVNNKAGEVISYAASFQTYAVADYDGNMYHTVTVGNQTWLKENLRTTHYANGDPIANITSATEWAKLSTPAYCYYNNNQDYAKVYGALYNWYVGADKRELISGWHTPTIYEFIDLQNYLGGYYPAGPATMDNSKLYWRNLTSSSRLPNNSTGLSIMPNGAIAIPTNTNYFSFMDLSTSATLWSSNADNDNMASCVVIDTPENYFNVNFLYPAKSGFGIRMLKN